MKKNMKHIQAIHAIVATIIIALNAFLLPHLNNEIVEILLGNVFVYTLTLIIVTKLYRSIWILFHKKYFIHGSWFVLQTIDKDPDYLRAGTAEITQDYYMFDIVAKTFNIIEYEKGSIELDKQKTIWIERLGTIQEDVPGDCTMSGNYTAKRFFDTSQMLVGVHQFEIQQTENKGYPSEITGYFFDSVPITDEIIKAENISNYNRIGRIEMFREKDKMIDYLIETYGETFKRGIK